MSLLTASHLGAQLLGSFMVGACVQSAVRARRLALVESTVVPPLDLFPGDDDLLEPADPYCQRDHGLHCYLSTLPSRPCVAPGQIVRLIGSRWLFAESLREQRSIRRVPWAGRLGAVGWQRLPDDESGRECHAGGLAAALGVRPGEELVDVEEHVAGHGHRVLL